MKTGTPVVLTLRIPFFALLIIAALVLWVVWGIPQLTLPERAGVSILLLPFMLFGLWRTSAVVKLDAEHIDSFKLFGLQPSKHRTRDDIREILLQPDYQNDIAGITLEFKDGRRIKLTGHYSNFYAARTFVTENWQGIPRRLLAPLARPDDPNDPNNPRNNFNNTFVSGDSDD
jgi:energy-coupling factor transporter transmembrane protein EcfT